MNNGLRASAAAAALSLAGVLAMTASAQATTFTVLHAFTGGADGGNPIDGISLDKAGNLYGTTYSGGSAYGGTAFELKHSKTGWAFDTLHPFAGGSDGSSPGARLLKGPDGHLYGTTTQGGGGAGTVFDLTASMGGGQRKETAIYTFSGSGNGYQPSDGDLAFDKHGGIFGTTSYGGQYNQGTVFELQHVGKGYNARILHSFGASGDGQIPVAGVILDAAGNLYGTTSAGGSAGYGTVYQLSASSGYSENVLWNFQAQNDGETPYAGLTFDANGNLYGGATDGGVNNGGVIFELSPGASGWTFNPIYSTPGWGVSGPFRTPYIDANGNIFGTTHCDGANSAGSVYELNYANGQWNYTALHDFTGGTDGAYVFAPPVFDGKGNIYGTTQIGGQYGYGVVWEISP
jgi:uncharacterized repeat protein (TIGR03803 family)